MALASAHSLPTPPIPKSLAAPRFNPRLAVGLLVLTSAILGLVAAYRGAQPRTVEVLRAAHDVQPGYVLQAADLQVVAEALPDDVAASLASASERPSLVGRRLAQPLNAGELITRRQTAPATDSSALESGCTRCRSQTRRRSACTCRPATGLRSW